MTELVVVLDDQAFREQYPGELGVKVELAMLDGNMWKREGKAWFRLTGLPE